MIRIVSISLFMCALSATTAQAISKCSGGNREARKVTCIVDGDTGWEQGVKWRLRDIDTPERGGRAKCARERKIHSMATKRLIALMNGGYTLSANGKDRYGRVLVNVTLSDGRMAGEILVKEGLAQAWPNSHNPWCE